MSSMDVKRCSHCVRPLVAVPLEADDGFDVVGSAVVCQYCDATAGDSTLYVPGSWD